MIEKYYFRNLFMTFILFIFKILMNFFAFLLVVSQWKLFELFLVTNAQLQGAILDSTQAVKQINK